MALKTKDERIADLKKGITEVLDAHGITTDMLAKKLKNELKAKETKFFQHEGEVVEIREVIDWSTRQKARMDAHRLRGDYPAERQEVEHSGVIVMKPDRIVKPDDAGRSNG